MIITVHYSFAKKSNKKNCYWKYKIAQEMYFVN